MRVRLTLWCIRFFCMDIDFYGCNDEFNILLPNILLKTNKLCACSGKAADGGRAGPGRRVGRQRRGRGVGRQRGGGRASVVLLLYPVAKGRILAGNPFYEKSISHP